MREWEGEQQENQYWVKFDNSQPLLSGRVLIVNTVEKEKVQEIKNQWKRLWLERFDDKLRAEGTAMTDYTALFVEKGTIIYATRRFRLLSFREILEQHHIIDAERYITPNPHTGGLTKFIKTKITNQSLWRKKEDKVFNNKTNKKKQRKKNGRGWLHK
jgi:hypothetical protein